MIKTTHIYGLDELLMKKINVLLALSLAFCFIFPGALAVKDVETYGRTTVRIGPGAKYDKICTLPSGVEMQAIEYEVKGKKLWHLVEFTLDGELSRGYADRKKTERSYG